MSYQVIARKYRPQRFAEVVGQDHVTQTLANAIRQNRIAHAYLFVGPRGTGKTTMERIFAKCLNASNGPTVDFSDDDARCKEITEGRALDVLEIDGASNRGIEEVRELRETVKYAPATSRFKIYIIDEVHMLTKEAFNALLKTLEEPPAHVKFMFATTEAEKILPTILSRCQRFDLRRIPTNLIVKHLGHIATQESVTVEEGALYAIARGADGGMRDAESTLDQLISFCGGKIIEADVLAMFGLAARDQINDLARSVVNGQFSESLKLLDELARGGKDLARLLSDLLGHFRNLLVYRITQGDKSLLEVSEAEAECLASESAKIETQAVIQVLDVLTESEGRLRDAASKKIFLEITLLKAIQARKAVSIDSVMQKLQQLRSDASGVNPSPSAIPVPIPFSQPTPADAASPALSAPSAPPPLPGKEKTLASVPFALVDSSDPPLESPRTAPKARRPLEVSDPPRSGPPGSTVADGDLNGLWNNLLDQVGKASPFAKTYLIEAHPVSLVRNVLTIGLDPEFADHMALMDNSKTRTLLHTKLQEAGVGQVQVKFIISERPSGKPGRAAHPPHPPDNEAPALKSASTPAQPPAALKGPVEKPAAAKPLALEHDDFKTDPLIRQALEIFRGQIIDVRS